MFELFLDLIPLCLHHSYMYVHDVLSRLSKNIPFLILALFSNTMLFTESTKIYCNLRMRCFPYSYNCIVNVIYMYTYKHVTT